jgi:hypothetical protein
MPSIKIKHLPIVALLAVGFPTITGCLDEKSTDEEMDEQADTEPTKNETKYPYLRYGAIICTAKRTFLEVKNSDLLYSNLPDYQWLPRNCIRTDDNFPLVHVQRRNAYASLSEVVVEGDSTVYWTSPEFIIAE